MNKKVIKSFWNEKWARVEFGGPTKNCWYEISNFGRIKSINKTSDVEKLLKGATVRGGLVILNQKLKNESVGMVYVHKFVAEHFLEKPSDEHTKVVHIDYDNGNNKWTNLKWVTPSDRTVHLKANPARPAVIMKKNYKLNETKVKMIKRMLAKGKTKKKIIAKNFGISENTLYKIEKGQRWGHVSIEDEDENDKKPDFVVE